MSRDRVTGAAEQPLPSRSSRPPCSTHRTDTTPRPAHRTWSQACLAAGGSPLGSSRQDAAQAPTCRQSGMVWLARLRALVVHRVWRAAHTGSHQGQSGNTDHRKSVASAYLGIMGAFSRSRTHGQPLQRSFRVAHSSCGSSSQEGSTHHAALPLADGSLCPERSCAVRPSVGECKHSPAWVSQ